MTRAPERSVDLHVTGQVQGVSFRWHTAREATRLGVAGWVRNDADGSVRAHVEGPEEAVAELVAWCEQGPPAARLAAVTVTDADPTGATSFVITG